MLWYKVQFVFTFVASYFALSFCIRESDEQEFLNAHNEERVAMNLEPLTWSDQVAAYAQNYAEQRKGDCELVHSDCTQYGENIAQSNGELPIRDAVQMWIDEKADYDYDSNTCAPNKACGHYTQVVWCTTTCVGCATIECDNGGTFITCNYEPPGNFVGEKPY